MDSEMEGSKEGKCHTKMQIDAKNFGIKKEIDDLKGRLSLMMELLQEVNREN